MENNLTYEKILDPNFINAELIGSIGSERIVTITDFTYADVFNQKTQKTDKKWSMSFEECKPLVLNKTNTKAVMKLFGTDPHDAIGKKIVLYVVSVKVGGQPTTGIRIKEYSAVKCDECKAEIKPTRTASITDLIKMSQKNCNGKTLCIDCMKKWKENHT